MSSEGSWRGDSTWSACRRRRSSSRVIRLATILFPLMSAALATEPALAQPAGSYHYLLLFAKNDSSPNNAPYLSHTFARFVRMSGAYPGDPAGELLEPPVDISWIPDQGFQKNWPVVLNFLPGKNIDLEASIAEVDRTRATLTLYGPYRVTDTLYQLARLQQDRLRSGSIRFRAFGVLLEHERGQYRAFNCYEAVADIGGYTLGLPTFGLTWGDAATRKVVEDFAPHILPTQGDLWWLRERFGVPGWVRRAR